MSSSLKSATAYVPVRLSELMLGQPIDLQRHIHTNVIREVGRGTLRGLKLADHIQLPHCHDINRMVSKSDILFLPEDIAAVHKIIAGTIAKYSESNVQMGRKRLTYHDSLKLLPEEFEEYYRMQLESDKRMKSYKREKK